MPHWRDEGSSGTRLSGGGGVELGQRLIQELLNIAAELGLHKVTFELVAHREEAGIVAAASAGLVEVATLEEHIQDFWGNYQDLVLMEKVIEDQR